MHRSSFSSYSSKSSYRPTLIMIVKLVLFLLAASLCDAESIASPRSRRSAKWDSYVTETLHHNRREPRSTGLGTSCGGDWQNKINNPTCSCTISELDKLSDDEIGHRRMNPSLLATPQHQGKCGNCWAFATAHAFTDYLSIRAGSQADVISAEYLTRCLKDQNYVSNGNGCCGGKLDAGPKFYRDVGAVTDACLPYSLRGFYNSRIYKFFRSLPDCPNECANPSTPFVPADLQLPGYRPLSTDQDVINALNSMTTVIAGLIADELFPTYCCGVYCRDGSSREAGRHAVEMVDYGTTANGIDFWVVKNSWGPKWGEGGYFRIVRGGEELTEFVELTSTPSGTESSTQSFYSSVCEAEEVDDPAQDPLIKSAADFGLEELTNTGRINCMNDSALPAASLNLLSISNASIQVVEGFSIIVEVRAGVTGCGEETGSTVQLNIVAETNGTFTLTEYVYDPDQPNGALTLSVALCIFLAPLLLAVYQGYIN